ncbi:M20/M25/M40 family metallo-hydrolase [Streptomyces sp. PA03-3a]|nr:M20/M25/M40 family metallo-hydrolase [Streptomyces sp. PA03-3a]
MLSNSRDGEAFPLLRRSARSSPYAKEHPLSPDAIAGTVASLIPAARSELAELVAFRSVAGARVSVEQAAQGGPFLADTSSPAYTAMADAMRTAYSGRDMDIAGLGGGIPLCNTLAALYPRAEVLLIGLCEPEAQIHAVDESVSVDELRRLAVAEAHFMRPYAGRGDRG